MRDLGFGGRVAWRRAVGRPAGVMLIGVLTWGGCRSAQEPPDAVPEAPTPSIATDPSSAPDSPAGSQPPELVWHPRRETRDPLVDFDFVLGWETRTRSGGEAVFTRSRERPLWGRYAGRLAFPAPTGASPVVVDLMPPEGLPLPDRFDCIELWVNRPMPAPGLLGEGSVDVAASVVDAESVRHWLPIGRIEGPGWRLLHRRIDPDRLSAAVYPCVFEGLRITASSVEGEVVLFLDSLGFFTEILKPLPLPASALPNLPQEDRRWMDASPDVPPLEVPTSYDTVLAPPSGSDSVSVAPEVTEEGDVRVTGGSGRLVFRFRAGDLFSGIEVLWDGESAGRFLAGYRVEGRAATRFAMAREEEGGLRIETADGWVFRCRVIGHSLVLDSFSSGTAWSGIEWGGYQGPARWVSVPVPGLVRRDRPGLAVVGAVIRDGKDPLWTSLVVDGYRSRGGVPRAGTPDGESWGGMVYPVRSDETRSVSRERLVLTVGPRLDQVLPGVPHPPGRYLASLADTVWVDAGAAGRAEADMERCRRLAALGIVRVSQGHGGDWWHVEGESRGLRTRVAPGRGGDAALRSLIDAQRTCGWLSGPYLNPLHLHPLNEFWAEYRVQRNADLSWRTGMPGHFLVKPAMAVDLATTVARELREAYGSGLTYVGDLTASPPWDYVDLDARLPGAGSMVSSLYPVADLLRGIAAETEGPVIGDGGWPAQYAGLVDGLLVLESPPAPWTPEFLLKRVQPLVCRFGAGPFPAVLTAQGETSETDRDRALDRYLAAELAHGSLGRLAPKGAGAGRQARSYYTIRSLQRRYAGRMPERIAYWSGEAMVPSSEALLNGIAERSQLYVNYGEALELWVNGSPTDTWTVRVGRASWTLPSFGWIAAGPELLALSALVDGHRVDYVADEDGWYFDGRGRDVPLLGMASRGPLVVRRGGDGSIGHLEVLSILGTNRLGLARTGLWGTLTESVQAEENEAPPRLERTDGWLWWDTAAENPRRFSIPLDPAGEPGPADSS